MEDIGVLFALAVIFFLFTETPYKAYLDAKGYFRNLKKESSEISRNDTGISPAIIQET